MLPFHFFMWRSKIDFLPMADPYIPNKCGCYKELTKNQSDHHPPFPLIWESWWWGC